MSIKFQKIIKIYLINLKKIIKYLFFYIYSDKYLYQNVDKKNNHKLLLNNKKKINLLKKNYIRINSVKRNSKKKVIHNVKVEYSWLLYIC